MATLKKTKKFNNFSDENIKGKVFIKNKKKYVGFWLKGFKGSLGIYKYSQKRSKIDEILRKVTFKSSERTGNYADFKGFHTVSRGVNQGLVRKSYSGKNLSINESFSVQGVIEFEVSVHGQTIRGYGHSTTTFCTDMDAFNSKKDEIINSAFAQFCAENRLKYGSPPDQFQKLLENAKILNEKYNVYYHVQKQQIPTY